MILHNQVYILMKFQHPTIKKIAFLVVRGWLRPLNQKILQTSEQQK